MNYDDGALFPLPARPPAADFGAPYPFAAPQELTGVLSGLHFAAVAVLRHAPVRRPATHASRGRDDRFELIGLRPLPPSHGLATLGYLLSTGFAQRMACGCDWATLNGVFSGTPVSSLFEHIRATPVGTSEPSSGLSGVEVLCSR